MEHTEETENAVTEDLSLIIETTEETKDLVPLGIVKTEANFATLPFFALSRQDASRRIEAEYRTMVERDGQRLEVLWQVTANAKYGYPRPFDRKVHKAIEHIITEGGFPVTNPVSFSIYRILQLLKLAEKGGKNYRKVRESLERVVTTTVKSEGTFFDKSKKQYITDVFHLYDRVIFRGRQLPNGETAESNYLFLSSWYLSSLNAYYIRPLDFVYLRSLRSDIASRLYELLGLKFYGVFQHNRRYWRVEYRELCDLLPITTQRYYSDAQRYLGPAHEELEKTGFLEKVEWAKESTGTWHIKYYPGKRAREEVARTQREFGIPEQLNLALKEPEKGQKASTVGQRKKSASEATSAPEEGPSREKQRLKRLLTDRGIGKRAAATLVKKYPKRIEEKAEILDWTQRNQPKSIKENPAGYLRQMIEEDWAAPAKFVSTADQARRKKELEEKHRKEAETEAQHIAEAQQVNEERKRRMDESPYRDIWGKVKEHLRGKMVSQSFSSWIAPLYISSIEDNKVVIDCPSAFALDLLEERYRSTLEEAVAEVQGREMTVELLCKEEGEG